MIGPLQIIFDGNDLVEGERRREKGIILQSKRGLTCPNTQPPFAWPNLSNSFQEKDITRYFYDILANMSRVRTLSYRCP
jgi:hypothetical protein